MENLILDHQRRVVQLGSKLKLPKVGDIYIWNAETQRKEFISPDLYDEGVTAFGVVFHVDANKVMIVSKEDQSQIVPFAAPFKAKISGFDFATGGSFTIGVNGSPTTLINYTTSDTLTTVAEAITAVINVGAAQSDLKNWIVTADLINNCIALSRSWYAPLIRHFYVLDEDNKITRSIICIDQQAKNSGLIPPYPSLENMDGSIRGEAGLNFEKYYSYLYSNGFTYTNQVVGAGDVIRYSVFNEVSNPALVAYYGSGEIGYANYIRDKMVKYPFPAETLIHADGKPNTDILSAATYTDIDGTIQPIFPPAYISKQFGISVGQYTGFEAGEWWLPSVHEMYLLIKDRKSDASDLVNVSLAKINGTLLNNANIAYWTCNEGVVTTAWYNYGSSGRLSNVNKFTSLNGNIPMNVRAITSLYIKNSLNLIPTISDIAVSLVGNTFAVTAKVNPKGVQLTPVLHYGLTTAYGSTLSATEGEISAAGTVTFTVSGLAQDTTYHYKIVAGATESENRQLENNVNRWVIPVKGRTGVTATAGTMVISTTEDITPIATGDVVISVVRAADSIYRQHTITVNCLNDGSGTIIIPDKSKVVSLGHHRGTSNPIIVFYNGADATQPTITISLNEIPSNLIKIYQDVQLLNSLLISGDSALPDSLLFFSFSGAQNSYSYEGALPPNLAYLRIVNVSYILNSAHLPSSLNFLEIIGVNNPILMGNTPLPATLTYLAINGASCNWTGLDVGGANLTTLNLQNYRFRKMSSADMVTLLTNLTNRTGTLPATITINDYADFAAPPQSVVDAVAALKLAKSITTVNLGQ